jgi:hypothetical protein
MSANEQQPRQRTQVWPLHVAAHGTLRQAGLRPVLVRSNHHTTIAKGLKGLSRAPERMRVIRSLSTLSCLPQRESSAWLKLASPPRPCRQNRLGIGPNHPLTLQFPRGAGPTPLLGLLGGTRLAPKPPIPAARRSVKAHAEVVVGITPPRHVPTTLLGKKSDLEERPGRIHEKPRGAEPPAQARELCQRRPALPS